MRKEFETKLEKINIIELRKLAEKLKITTEINNKAKAKTTLINEIIDYFFTLNDFTLLREFCMQGILIFYPFKIINSTFTGLLEGVCSKSFLIIS